MQFQTRLSHFLRLAPPSAGLCSNLKSEMDYVKESALRVSGGAPIIAKIIQRFKNCSRHATSELQSPLLCLLLAYLTSFVAAAPFFRTKDPRVALRAYKFVNKALHTLADVEDKDLSEYLNCKATAWYRRFPLLHSQDRIDDTKKARDAEGPEEPEQDASDTDDADALRPMLSDDEDESDGGGEE